VVKTARSIDWRSIAMDTVQTIRHKRMPSKKRAFWVGMVFQLVFLILLIAVLAIAYTVQKTKEVAEKAQETAVVITKTPQFNLKQNTIDLKTAKDLATKVTNEKVEAARKEFEEKLQEQAHEFHVHQDNANAFRVKVNRKLGTKGE
jgi:cell division protein FtsI/penicillin-binding protein 2